MVQMRMGREVKRNWEQLGLGKLYSEYFVRKISISNKRKNNKRSWTVGSLGKVTDALTRGPEFRYPTPTWRTKQLDRAHLQTQH